MCIFNTLFFHENRHVYGQFEATKRPAEGQRLSTQIV
jgi:hypothetical protein